MDERSSRIFFGLCMLVLVWIGVYWMWEPASEQDPVITFANHRMNHIEVEQKIDEAEVIEREDNSDLSQSNDQEPAFIAQVIDVPAPRLIPPEFTEHIVRPDELMQTIAKEYFGSIDDWTIIAKANPKIDPRKLKPGMVLRIPKDKTNIQGKLVGAETEPGVIVPHTDDGSKVIEYIVQSGDSLSMISQRIYGSSTHAQFIFESNRGTLRSMDSISIGQLLKLPPLPERSTQSNPDE